MYLKKSYIRLHDLHFHAYHGVMDQERLVGNDYTVNVSVGAPLQAAVQTDRVEDTVNYATLYELVKAEMEKPSALLEHVAGRMAQRIFTTFSTVTEVRVAVKKLNPPFGADCQGAEVELYFTKEKTK